MEILTWVVADEKYFSSVVVKCKDGSKAFHRARLNDNYCDCADGTDEPGIVKYSCSLSLCVDFWYWCEFFNAFF